MPSTLRLELTKAGFTPGNPSTTMIVQDYSDPAVSGGHAKTAGSHTITSTDPILDRSFAGGDQWLGARRIVAYDPNFVYMMVNLPTRGSHFLKVPLTAAQITGTTPVPHVSLEKAIHATAA